MLARRRLWISVFAAALSGVHRKSPTSHHPRKRPPRRRRRRRRRPFRQARRSHEFYALRERTHVVVPIGDRDVAAHVSPQFQPGFEPDQDPGLPHPRGTSVHGHRDLRDGWWVYALPSPDGSRLLAQWSGECEVPHAFFIDGRSVITVDGFERIGPAADSWALGWTRDGRAVVSLSGGACSTAFSRPGVYLVSGPGDGELLVGTEGAARMWNPA